MQEYANCPVCQKLVALRLYAVAGEKRQMVFEHHGYSAANPRDCRGSGGLKS